MLVERLGKERYQVDLNFEVVTRRPVSLEDTPFSYEGTITLGEELICKSPDTPFDCYAWEFFSPPVIDEEQEEEDVGVISLSTSRWPTVLPVAVIGNPAGAFLENDGLYLYPKPGDRFRTPHRKYWEFTRGEPVFVTMVSAYVDRDFSGEQDVCREAVHALLDAMADACLGIAKDYDGIVYDDISWCGKRTSAERLAKRQWRNMEMLLDREYIADMRTDDIAMLARKSFIAHNGLGEGRAERRVRLYAVEEPVEKE